jgi:hypothetical protein
MRKVKCYSNIRCPRPQIHAPTKPQTARGYFSPNIAVGSTGIAAFEFPRGTQVRIQEAGGSTVKTSRFCEDTEDKPTWCCKI